MSICLVLLCWHGFLEILIALVLSKKRNASHVNTKIFELLSYPQQLSTTSSSYNIFRLCCEHGNWVFFLGCPRYQTGSKKMSHTWGDFSINQESFKTRGLHYIHLFLVVPLNYQPGLVPSDYSELIKLVLEHPLGVNYWFILWPWYKVPHLVPFKLMKLFLHCCNSIWICKSFINILRLNVREKSIEST